MTTSQLRKRAMLLHLSVFFIVAGAFSQGNPVSQSANSMVDLNTGDFNYSLPVMTVPGPNGENIPITFGYRGGIKVDEQASWIGLGWNYNPGEISHNVKGVSDDWKGKQIEVITYPVAGSSSSEYTDFFGPIYYKNYTDPLVASMDVATSSYKLSNGLFYMPNYDSYNVSGPGISGTMEPRLFDLSGVVSLKSTSSLVYSSSLDTFDESPQFIFTDELNSKIYPSGTDYSGAYDATTNRAHTASYIEYFTNYTINNATPSGFLDYRIISGTKRPSGDFDADDIGAFRITSPDGKVYHYSLPVYMQANEESINFPMDLPSGIDNDRDMKVTKKLGKYVVSWKLTAVTGPDYSDANSNGIADFGDTGYWIAYNYGLWTNNFKWKNPFFGYNPNLYTKSLDISTGGFKDYLTDYRNEGTISSGEVQTYYLNSIQTSTHTAYFIKEVRADAHAVKDGSNYIKPSLRLNKIVLVRNESISLFGSSASLPSISGFNFSGCTEANVQPHIGNYSANEALIKKNTIAAVELTADYSLCKLVSNNIHNSFSTTWNTWHSTNIFQAATTSSSADDNSGKLTLNEVKIYGTAYKANGPSYQFDYDKSNSTKNPNYAHEKMDYWGNYKSDYSSTNFGRYTSSASASNVDAWSLKKITTPLGGEILVEYESDFYEYSCNNNRSFTRPYRYFLINEATRSTNTDPWDITLNSEINSFLSSATRKEMVLRYDAGYGGCHNVSDIGSDPVLVSGGPGMTMSATGSATAVQHFLASATSNYTIGQCPATSGYSYDPNVNQYGHVKLSFDFLPGGGTRVKKITLKDTESNQSYINEYSYERGIAGSEPLDMLVKTDYGTLEKNNNANDPFIPGAYVTYQKVNVKSRNLNTLHNGRTQYEFHNSYEPFSVYSTEPDLALYLYPPYNLTDAEIDYRVTETSGILNQLKSITVYDSVDNIVRLTKYEYDVSDAIPAVAEKFRHYVDVSGSSDFYTLHGTHTKIDRKARLKRKTDYFNGITTTEEPLAWDPITGEVTKNRLTNPTEGVTETTIDPAFRNSSYITMGPKSIDDDYNNIVTAPYKITVTKDKLIRDVYNTLLPAGSEVMTGGSKTTWRQTTFPKRVYNNTTGTYETQSTSSTLWRPYQTYVFNGNTNDASWKYEGEVTVFNKRNSAIEAKNGNNRYTATKMGYDQQFALCQAIDAKYADFAFSGFEDQETVYSGVVHFGGEITHGEMRYAGDATIKPHTGNYMAKVEPGYGPGHFAVGFTAGRSYRASVWVHKNSPSAAALYVTLDGTSGGGAYSQTKTVAKSDAANITVGDWILMTTTIDIPADYVGSGGSLNDLRVYCNNAGSTVAYYDDLMIRPVDATLSGNVIDEKTGQTLAVLDNYNFATKYVYDDAGRVREIWMESPTEGWKLKQRYSYNFKRTY